MIKQYIRYITAVIAEKSELFDSTYNTMIEIVKNSDSIGLMTKEYFNKEIENKEIMILKTDFKIKPVEYGIYINRDNKFKELKDFINIIKGIMLA